MPIEFFTNSLIPTPQKTKTAFAQNFYDAVWCTYVCLWTCFLVPHEVWKAAIPKLWHYFSVFFTVDFLGKVNLLAHTQCLHFSHFCFNSISNTLILFLLKPCRHLISKLDAAASVSHLPSLDASLDTSLILTVFFFSLPLPSPRPKHWWFRRFLSHLFHTFSIAHLWNVENMKGSVFSLTSW